MYETLGRLFQVRATSNWEDNKERDVYAQSIFVTDAAQDLPLHVLIHPEAVWKHLHKDKITSFWLQADKQPLGNWKISFKQ